MADLMALHAVLSPGSVVDASDFFYNDFEHVDEFLRLSGFDTDNPIDNRRLRELHIEATTYLTEVHSYRIPEDVQYPNKVHDLFLIASSGTGRSKLMACMCLKTMHIMHHVNARQLVFNTAFSEAQLFSRLNAKIFDVIDRMRAKGIQVLEFAASQKARESVVTKLLAKRETLATHLFDKLRFRVVLGSKDDLVPALLYLLKNLVPFNYVVPGQSRNGLVSAKEISACLGLTEEAILEFWRSHEGNWALGPTPPNEFSGRSFQCVNFVAEIPLRIDDVAPEYAPAIAFAQTEIQLVDEKTHLANNEGENAHDLYKERQRRQVRERLQGLAD
tara:strand:- start:8 stop:1000 length:993 start_codon:yes stop_codon:yes gene_type:complete